ncbi:MAG: 4Fe-4S ferredoxin [Spirochaetia bacterium]
MLTGNEEAAEIIQTVYNSLEKNTFSTLGRPNEPKWEPPVMGTAAGDDPYYAFLKDHIGEFHWSPEEVFALKYKDKVPGRDLRVISIVFPQTLATKKAQSKERVSPSREWIISRGEWEPLMEEFNGKLIKELEERGVRTVSLDLRPELKTVQSEKQGFASNWSHRHTAFIAGLGTFGLSDGLITEKGKAVRFTSLVVEAPLTPTERTYTSHNEWCLYYKTGGCGVCMKRCPIDAISFEGHDKAACEAYEGVIVEKYWPPDLEKGDFEVGCGLCQVKIPCQHKKP